MKKIILAAVFVSLWGSMKSQLVVNEIMSNNVSAVMDETYNYSMWVELYNAGETEVNQSAYYISDTRIDLKKWRPESKIIPPGGYSVLWFEGEEHAGHASFKLNPEGGGLFLSDSAGEIVDNMAYPAQYRNISYGRKTDGGDEWVYFEEYSNGASNDGRKWGVERCAKPFFSLPGGFYSGSQSVSFVDVPEGEDIYYTTNGDEPTKSNAQKYTPNTSVTFSKTTILRARAFADNKLSSDVVTATYFVNEREFNLPVVSIVTEDKNLNDDMIGIYVVGKNGITGVNSGPANYNQDWSRPANFELYDTTKVSCLNQELDIAISGGWTRTQGQKSLKIQPRKKFGDNRLRYSFFEATKPGLKYKDIQLRNSGNDFPSLMMRDAFAQSIVINRMNIDYQAYEPAVCFMNGQYWGIQNLRERTNKDYIYSNYGLDEDEIHILETTEIQTDPEFQKFVSFLRSNNPALPEVYEQISGMIDIESYIDYMIAEMYYANVDWPHNNFKVWKPKENGKWRWILFDTDYGLNFHDANGHNNHNPINMVFRQDQEWAVYPIRRLILNESFRNKFVDRYCIHMSSTFKTERVDYIMDSLASKISDEIVYHKKKWGGRDFNSEIANLKNFTKHRADKILNDLAGSSYPGSSVIYTIHLSSNNLGASYKFNDEQIVDDNISLKYFKDRQLRIEPQSVPGYKFKHWEILASELQMQTLMPMGSQWKYWDGNAMPASNWYSPDYNDNAWNEGEARLGYGDMGEKTTIGYGGNEAARHPTAYFRKSVTINDLASKESFEITVFVDDGAAVYVNGTEVGRQNLPSGVLGFNTLAPLAGNGVTATFPVPKNVLKEGKNVIAVEVHQVSLKSTDLIFDLSLKCADNSNTGDAEIYDEAVYSVKLAGNVRLKAVYEEDDVVDEYENAKVLINEIVSGNNFISDEYGETDDYIELYNASDFDVNIAGWYLTDKIDNKTLSRILTEEPDKTLIPAKERLIIWVDEQPEQGVLHVGFKLSGAGETLMLSRQNTLGKLLVMDSVAFPLLEDDMSYSRVPDGGDIWQIQEPTFNRPNTSASWDGVIEYVDGEQFVVTVADDCVILNNVQNERIRIYDLGGRIMYETMSAGGETVIRVSDWAEGMYIINIGTASCKFMKH